jgi:hypothetical protein
MQRPRLTRLSVTTIGIAISLVLGLLLVPRPIRKAGAVTAVGVNVYWDYSCTNTTTSMDWGTMNPGQTKSYIVYIKNSQSTPLALGIDYSDWNPTNASNCVTPTWNCTNYNLNGGSVVAATLTITISQNASTVTNFQYDTTITGTSTTLQSLASGIMQDPAQTVYYMRTGNIYDDSALGFFYGKSSQAQNMISQNNPTYINQASGRPLVSGDIVLFGGRCASKVLNYYENNSISKIRYSYNATHALFIEQSTGRIAYAVPYATYNPSARDYFVVQAFSDGNRTVLSQWGISAYGTYASGLCFDDIVWPNITNYANSYYIYCWQDLNGDGLATTNEITLVASGN